jgi:hypothetical protein
MVAVAVVERAVTAQRGARGQQVLAGAVAAEVAAVRAISVVEPVAVAVAPALEERRQGLRADLGAAAAALLELVVRADLALRAEEGAPLEVQADLEAAVEAGPMAVPGALRLLAAVRAVLGDRAQTAAAAVAALL